MTTKLSLAPNEVELQVKVSNKQNVRRYGFAYAGKPVLMNLGKGTFRATKNVQGLLEWVMLGDPGGTIKVEVLRGQNVIYTREQSQIVPPYSEGFDAFQILVS